jgi:hypothetical protein
MNNQFERAIAEMLPSLPYLQRSDAEYAYFEHLRRNGYYRYPTARESHELRAITGEGLQVHRLNERLRDARTPQDPRITPALDFARQEAARLAAAKVLTPGDEALCALMIDAARASLMSDRLKAALANEEKK